VLDDADSPRSIESVPGTLTAGRRRTGRSPASPLGCQVLLRRRSCRRSGRSCSS
jgi:hypothetical protein